MTEQQWKQMQQTLKSIEPGEGDGPVDAQRFKRRVLEEYERRSRSDLRKRWWRMTAAAVTVGAAVWAGGVVVQPMLVQTGEQVRAGVESHNVPTDKHDQSRLSQVKFETRQDQLPTAELTAFDSLQPSPLLEKLTIPAEKKVDVQREYGMYVLNGSVQTFSFGGGALRVEVSKERGNVQVLAVPYEQITPFEGQSFEVQVYDENTGKLLETQVVHVPKVSK